MFRPIDEQTGLQPIEVLQNLAHHNRQEDEKRTSELFLTAIIMATGLRPSELNSIGDDIIASIYIPSGAGSAERKLLVHLKQRQSKQRQSKGTLFLFSATSIETLVRPFYPLLRRLENSWPCYLRSELTDVGGEPYISFIAKKATGLGGNKVRGKDQDQVSGSER